MYIESNQPIPRCSKCGSILNHTYKVDVSELRSKIKKEETWRICEICQHEALESTFSYTVNSAPLFTQYQKPEMFKDF